MIRRHGRDPRSAKPVLRFLATGALVVAPQTLVACGGSSTPPDEPHTNVGPEEHTNVGPEEPPAPEPASPDSPNPESPEVDPPHTNVGPEAAPE
jgi:hypothetical protein